MKNSPSPQLINHAISVVLERRYRRALKKSMPGGQEVVTITQRRETGKGRKRVSKSVK